MLEHVFGTAWNVVCNDVRDKGMQVLMNVKKDDGDTGAGYNWRGESSHTVSDILELLRSDKMVDLVK